MPGIDLETALGELYGQEPAAFVAARNQLAKRLRATHEREAADLVAKLRRPTPAAWALNQVRRGQPDLVDELLGTRQAVEKAQGGGGGPLREVMAAHRDASRRVLTAAGEALAGAGREPASAALDLRQLLDAVLAGDEGRQALRAGRLAGTESSAPDELAGMLEATAARAGTGRRSERDGGTDEVARRRQAKAEAELRDADAAHDEARAARDAARDRHREAERALRDAQRALTAAERAADTAAGRAERARHRLDALTTGRG